MGLSWAGFQGATAVPWNDATLCGLLKEIPTALIALFQNAKPIGKFNIILGHDTRFVRHKGFRCIGLDLFHSVIGRLFDDNHVVDMPLSEACWGNLNEAGFGLKRLDIEASQIAHAGL